jgi:hypothetical protein
MGGLYGWVTSSSSAAIALTGDAAAGSGTVHVEIVCSSGGRKVIETGAGTSGAPSTSEGGCVKRSRIAASSSADP